MLRAHYLRRRAEARARGERLSLATLAHLAGLVTPGREPDSTWIGRLLGITPMPDGRLRTRTPLSLALALGAALGLDPHEVEAGEIRPQPARFQAPCDGPPELVGSDDPATAQAIAA